MFKYLNQKQRVLKVRPDWVKRFISLKIGQFLKGSAENLK